MKGITKTLIALTLALVFLLPAIACPVVAFQDPHPVYGTIETSDGKVVEGAQVTVTNMRTGEKLEGETSTEGTYIIELLNLPSGYQDGDILKVEAEKDGLEGTEESKIALNQSDGGTRVDITISTPTEAEGIMEIPLYIILIVIFGVIGIIILLLIMRKKSRGYD